MRGAATTQRLAFVLLLALSMSLPTAMPLEFDMLFQTKCVMEEINRNVLVVGDFAAFHKDNSANLVPMDVKVSSPKHGNIDTACSCTNGAHHAASAPTLWSRRNVGPAGGGSVRDCAVREDGVDTGAICLHDEGGRRLQSLLHSERRAAVYQQLPPMTAVTACCGRDSTIRITQ